MHILIGGILGLIGLLWVIFQVVGVFFAIVEFLAEAIAFILGLGVILCVGIVALIIGGIYFALTQFDQSLANAFLITSLGGIVAFFIFGVTAYNKKEDGIKTMNRIRYGSVQLTDDELNKFIENKSIGKFERIGYMAAFADRYPPRKNLVVDR